MGNWDYSLSYKNKKIYEFPKYFYLVPQSIQIAGVLLLNHFQSHIEQHNK